MNDKQPFGINGRNCDGFIWKTFKTEISSGKLKVGINNPPQATEIGNPTKKPVELW